MADVYFIALLSGAVHVLCATCGTHRSLCSVVGTLPLAHCCFDRMLMHLAVILPHIILCAELVIGYTCLIKIKRR